MGKGQGYVRLTVPGRPELHHLPATIQIGGVLLEDYLRDWFKKDGTYPDLTAGDFTPKTDTPVYGTSKYAIHTTGGDLDLLNGKAHLRSIKGTLTVVNGVLKPFKADTFVSTKENLVNPTQCEHYGDDILYWFPVAKGTWGSYGTTEENNGYVIIGGGTISGVYVWPTMPTSAAEVVTGGVLCPYHDENGKRYYLPATDCYLCVLASELPACHVAWSNEDDEIPGEYGSRSYSIEDPVFQIHENDGWTGMAGVTKHGTPAFDEVDFENKTTYARVNRAVLADATWTQTTRDDDGTTVYIYTATISDMKVGGAWESLYEGLQVNGNSIIIESTTLDTVAGLKEALGSKDIYYAMATERSEVFSSFYTWDGEYNAYDMGLTYFLYEELVKTPAYVTEGFYQSGKDRVWNSMLRTEGEMSEVIAEAFAYLNDRVDGIYKMVLGEGEGNTPNFPLNIKPYTVDAKNIRCVGVPTILYCSQAGAPAAARIPDNWDSETMGQWTGVPMFIGQLFVDMTTPKLYCAKALTAATSDWFAV